MEQEGENDTFLNNMYELANNDDFPINNRRRECEKCRRPKTVCWCPYLPTDQLNISTTVYILQHPFEELRKLKTAPMLLHSLPEGKCQIIRGKHFSQSRYPELATVLQSPNTVVLYPGSDAIDIAELPALDTGYNLVALDGTWTQAKGMYLGNKLLKLPRQVQINCDRKSLYVVKTQPTDGALSTLESVAIALSVVERQPNLVEVLTRPLEALCDFQLSYGAVEHMSKEYRISHGLWDKQLPQKLIKRLEREKEEQLRQES